MKMARSGWIISLSVSAVPFYQDHSFNFNFPGKKYGKFSITGIGRVSDIQ
jgi:hypothetical protein